MSKSFNTSKSNSFSKTKMNNLNNTNLSSNQSRYSVKSENKPNKVSNKDSKSGTMIQFMPVNKKESNVDFLKNNIEENLRCMVCKNLFKEPVCCYKCLAIYCFSCIKRETDEHCRCPSCFSIVFSELMIYMEADYKENYKKYNLKCPNEGCKESYNLNEITEHLSSCIFILVNNTEKIQKITYSNTSHVIYS